MNGQIELGKSGDESPQSKAFGGTGRLPVQTVERLHRLVGGDARVEGFILRFIPQQYRAKNLFYLKPDVARKICRRPGILCGRRKSFVSRN
jgi:hypothetical protein